MSTVYSKDGSTYTTGGITYDASTGRPVTPDGGFLLEAEKKSEINKATKGQATAKSQRRGGVLRYPLEALTGTTDYLQIDILEYKRPKNQLTRPAGFGTNTAKAIKENNLKLDIKAPMKDVPSMTRAIELYIKQANKV